MTQGRFSALTLLGLFWFALSSTMTRNALSGDDAQWRKTITPNFVQFRHNWETKPWNTPMYDPGGNDHYVQCIWRHQSINPLLLNPRLEHPAGWICARYKSLLLLLLLLSLFVAWFGFYFPVFPRNSLYFVMKHICIQARPTYQR